MSAPIVELQGVTRTHDCGGKRVTVLDRIGLSVRQGDFVAIVGPPCSGKSALLSLIAGIDRPTAGRIVVAGLDLASSSDRALTAWRRRTVGVVFQLDQLIPFLSAAENVELALLPLPMAKTERRARSLAALSLVGLAQRARRYPRELGQDENRRLALARALVTDPQIIVADEPTARLDRCHVQETLALLERWSEQLGRTVVVGTGDPGVALRARTRYHIAEGALMAWGCPAETTPSTLRLPCCAAARRGSAAEPACAGLR
jgi:putative ABC transport system ATP-binding protein